MEKDIYLASFGYNKSGPPADTAVYDARHINNPHHFMGTKKTGRDREVREYVMHNSNAKKLVDDIVRDVLDGQKYVSVGCAWGHHRSVSVVEQVAINLKRLGHKSIIEHMELK